MKMRTRLFALMLMVMLALVCTAGAFASELDSSKKVDKIDIGQMPTKTAYVSGEEFSLEGGTILVTYEDGTTQEIPMTDDGLSVKAPGMSASGTKTVTIKCGKKSARFTVKVANASFLVTYDQNYEGAPTAETAEVVKGQKAENLQPVREGYTFAGWYADADFTAAFDFATEITADATLYALWTKNGADLVQVTFDYDYYGVALSSYTYPVEKGTAVARPHQDPVRQGYTFAQWVDAQGDPFDFAQALTEDTTIKASWVKSVSGMQTYIFEAEDTNLSGKTGPAISGTANEIGMIVLSEGRNASNDRAVGYLYQNGLSLEFYLACDEAVEDATIQISLSAEMEDLTLTPATYGIYLNGAPLQYGEIAIVGVPAYDPTAYVADCAEYQYYLVGTNLPLQKGANLIKVVTENSISYSGTTMVAHAPLVDAVKIETSAVVIWDETHGVPALGNYKK